MLGESQACPLTNAEKSDHLELLRKQTVLARFGELALTSDDRTKS